jgi:predicted HD superfamily hydrolase involved in NAD metabolism
VLCSIVHAQLGSRHRYRHVVGVARLADRLAAHHGEDSAKARLAGMLHDFARLYSAERLIAECELREMPIDAFERAHPIVLHARLGAELVRERCGIDDEAVLSAIRKHTVAAPQMSRLDELVYLADGLEPGRTFAQRADLERLAFSDVDAAMLGTLHASIAFLEDRGAAVAPQTLAALAVYEKRRPASAVSAAFVPRKVAEERSPVCPT